MPEVGRAVARHGTLRRRPGRRRSAVTSTGPPGPGGIDRRCLGAYGRRPPVHPARRGTSAPGLDGVTRVVPSGLPEPLRRHGRASVGPRRCVIVVAAVTVRLAAALPTFCRSHRTLPAAKSHPPRPVRGRRLRGADAIAAQSTVPSWPCRGRTCNSATSSGCALSWSTNFFRRWLDISSPNADRLSRDSIQA